VLPGTLALGLSWASVACGDVTLARGLSQTEARELAERLNRSGVAVSTVADGGGGRLALQAAPDEVPRVVQTLARQREPAAPEPSATALLPTQEAAVCAREASLARQLRTAILALPNVESADIVLTLPRVEHSLQHLLQPAPERPARAAVSLTYNPRVPAPDLERIRTLIVATIPGIAAPALHIEMQPSASDEPRCAELTRLGPLTLTRQSLSVVKLWLVASLLVHMLCASALIFILQRRRRGAAGSPQ
jgi:type III secretory pathway lipoprotein EscJ